MHLRGRRLPLSSSPRARAWIHSFGSVLFGLVAAVILDGTLRFVRLGLGFGTAAWACALSATVAGCVAAGADWAVGAPKLGTKQRLATVACTALWGAWLAGFCVRFRWGWVSLDRIDGGSGPPAQLALVLLSLSGLSASFFGRYLVAGASSRKNT